MLIDDLALYLEQQGFGQRASSIFIDHAARQVDNAIILLSAGELEQDKYVDVRQTSIDLLVQDKSAALAEAKIESVWESLHVLENVQFANHLVYYMEGSSVSSLGDSPEGHRLLRMRLTALYREGTEEIPSTLVKPWGLLLALTVPVTDGPPNVPDPPDPGDDLVLPYGLLLSLTKPITNGPPPAIRHAPIGILLTLTKTS